MKECVTFPEGGTQKVVLKWLPWLPFPDSPWEEPGAASVTARLSQAWEGPPGGNRPRERQSLPKVTELQQKLRSLNSTPQNSLPTQVWV